jgi:hypothetical protein
MTSRLQIACFDTNLSMTLDRSSYVTTDTANMTVRIYNNNTFSMNTNLVIELRDATSLVKTMVVDTVNIANNSWYNYSYYNNFVGIPTGVYTMRLRLLDLSNYPLTDCSNNELRYDYPNVAVSETGVISIGGGGAALFPEIYGVRCLYHVEMDKPMNVEINITNPSDFLYQTVLFLELSKGTIKKEVKHIVISKPQSSLSWNESLGNVTCNMPQGVYYVNITWKRIDGNIIRSDQLGCFEVPPCEKLEITNLLTDKNVYYVNDTANITATVVNRGNTNVTDAVFNLSIENLLTGDIFLEHFTMDELYPGQYYLFNMFVNLTETGPRHVTGIIGKDNKILDRVVESFLVICRPTQYGLVLFIILILGLTVLTLKVAKMRRDRMMLMRKTALLKTLKKKRK